MLREKNPTILHCDRCDKVIRFPGIPTEKRPTIANNLIFLPLNDMNSQRIYLCDECRSAVYHFIFDYYIQQKEVIEP